MKHEMELAVRHYECDAYNHVNNATYLNYLEYARECFLKEAGIDYFSWLTEGNGIWVSEFHLEYQSPAVADETLTILSQTYELGGAYAVLTQSIKGPKKRSVLQARVKLVWVGPKGRPTRIPHEWRYKLSPPQNLTAV
jgi:acyl-CoA thioester hydrolase